MQKRSIAVLVLLGYSAILINLVVFKSPRTVAEWANPHREGGPAGQRPSRGRGPARGAGTSESRGGRVGPGVAGLPGPPLSTSRFAQLHANYVPFKTIWPQLRGRPRWGTAIVNLVGNIILFVPVGFLAVLVCPNMKWRRSLVLAVAVGVSMEVMQGIFRIGVVDVDDVILNALGVMIG